VALDKSEGVVKRHLSWAVREHRGFARKVEDQEHWEIASDHFPTRVTDSRFGQAHLPPFRLSYIDCMHLFINGEEKTFAAPLSLAELIEQLGMKGDRVAVELNREIVARAQWAETQLNDGDRLEIVHFVGGG